MNLHTELRAALTTAFEEKLAKLPVGGVLNERFQNHELVFIATRLDGMHTGRTRFMVGCTLCNVLVHHATTGPLERAQQHIEDALKDAWDGKCPADLHGLDYYGQKCDLCAKAAAKVIFDAQLIAEPVRAFVEGDVLIQEFRITNGPRKGEILTMRTRMMP